MKLTKHIKTLCKPKKSYVSDGLRSTGTGLNSSKFLYHFVGNFVVGKTKGRIRFRKRWLPAQIVHCSAYVFLEIYCEYYFFACVNNLNSFYICYPILEDIWDKLKIFYLTCSYLAFIVNKVGSVGFTQYFNTVHKRQSIYIFFFYCTV